MNVPHKYTEEDFDFILSDDDLANHGLCDDDYISLREKYIELANKYEEATFG